MPRSPSFRIRVRHWARANSSEASGRTTESWSPRANRASPSLGVIRSKSLNSVMLPQRLATWLSATRKAPAGIPSTRAAMVCLLKIPWRKSLKTTMSAGVAASWARSWSTTSREIGRLSRVSTLSMR